MGDDRVMLTHEQAVAMLPDGIHVHTFTCPVPGVLMGADFIREKLIAHMKEHGPVELSGPLATRMGHGMCLKDEHGRLFIATREASELGEEIQS